jgi:hypothetical protein
MSYIITGIKFWTSIVPRLFKNLETISDLDDAKKETEIKKIKSQLAGKKDMLYQSYAEQLKDIIGERPYKGKWDNNYSVELNEDNNLIITGDKTINGTIFNFLKSDILKEPKIISLLENPHFIELFSELVTIGLYSLGQNLMNMGGIASEIVKLINEKTDRKYALLNCRDRLGSYTCGRAVSINLKPGDKDTPRIIIFNTKSENDDEVDFERYFSVLPTKGEQQYTLDGDKHYYWKKYLKYKQKYINLKKLYKDFI